MRRVMTAFCLLGVLAAAVAAQTPPTTPPAGARDITVMPDSQTAPSATIAPPASVVRIYIENLSGADATALAGLITQALFQSKQVVVTTNESNASLILRGSVLREPIPHASDTSESARRGAKRHGAPSSAASDNAPTSSPFGDSVNVTALPPLPGAAGSADSSGLGSAEDAAGLALPSLGGMDSPADLTQYRYRLNLELLNPSGDLLWMSGQGAQALPYQDADDAVSRTLTPMLTAVQQLSAAAGAGH